MCRPIFRVQRLPLLLFGLLLCQPAWSQVYRWLDENGQVQFGDRPPPDMPAEVHPIELPPPATEPPEEENRYSIQQQLERMEQARAEREAARPKPPPKPEPVPVPVPVEVRSYWRPAYYPPLRPWPPVHPQPPWPWTPPPEPVPIPQPGGRLHLP